MLRVHERPAREHDRQRQQEQRGARGEQQGRRDPADLSPPGPGRPAVAGDRRGADQDEHYRATVPMTAASRSTRSSAVPPASHAGGSEEDRTRAAAPGRAPASNAGRRVERAPDRIDREDVHDRRPEDDVVERGSAEDRECRSRQAEVGRLQADFPGRDVGHVRGRADEQQPERGRPRLPEHEDQREHQHARTECHEAERCAADPLDREACQPARRASVDDPSRRTSNATTSPSVAGGGCHGGPIAHSTQARHRDAVHPGDPVARPELALGADRRRHRRSRCTRATPRSG